MYAKYLGYAGVEKAPPAETPATGVEGQGGRPDNGPEGKIQLMAARAEKEVPEETPAGSSAQDAREMKEKAYDSHSEAYLEAGLADLETTDLTTIAGVVDFGDFFDVKALKNS